jgi:hypothetical protein
MLEHYNVSGWTEGIDLERSTLRDRVKNWFLTLRSRRPKDLRRGWGKEFPRRRMTLGSYLARPREVQSPDVRFWERWPPVVREKEREKREAMVGV